MIILRRVELRERHDLRDDGRVPDVRAVEFGDDGFGGLALFGRVVEDGGAILRANVRALPVERRRVVDCEEDFDEFAVRRLARIEGYLNDLGVAGRSVADLTVRWIRNVAARVTRHDASDAAQVFEDSLKTPEAPARKRRHLAAIFCAHRF